MTPEQERLLIATADAVGALLATLGTARGPAGKIIDDRLREISDAIVDCRALEDKE